VPKVDAIVRAKNGHDMTKRCVDSIVSTTEGIDVRVVLVDDGSTPALNTVIASDVYVRHRESRGAVSATNSGLAQSFLFDDSEYVLILDNDTEIPKNDPTWLVRMVAELHERGPAAACVGATTTYANRPQHILAVPQTYTGDWTNGTKSGMKTQPPQIWFVSFAVLFHKRVLRSLGYWDEQYNPGNWEDTDYAMKCRISGYTVHVAQSVFIHHHGSKTFSDNLQNLLAENKAKFINKWGPGRLWDLGLISDRDVSWMLQHNKES